MDNFLFSVNATIPIFLVILIGYFLRRIGLFTENFVSVANKYVFQIALPVMLFKEIATSDILNDASGAFVIFCMVVTIVMFLAAWLVSFFVIKDKSMIGSFAQGSARGSAAILGVAFVENICGDAGMAPLMIVAAVPFFNVLSVIILTFSADMGKTEAVLEQNGDVQVKAKTGAIKKSLINIVKNPIIIGIVLGIPFALLKIKLPAIPLRTIGYISQTATPVALLAIGGGFDGKQAVTRLKPALGASFIKLIALPAIFMPLTFKFDFGGSEMIAILIMLASPTTVSSYVMAKNMNNDDVLASNIILITTLLSSVTLTLWIFMLKSMGAI